MVDNILNKDTLLLICKTLNRVIISLPTSPIAKKCYKLLEDENSSGEVDVIIPIKDNIELDDIKVVDGQEYDYSNNYNTVSFSVYNSDYLNWEQAEATILSELGFLLAKYTDKLIKTLEDNK